MKVLPSSFWVLIFLSQGVAFSQGISLHDPQELYDDQGGLYDPTILRGLNVVFEDEQYHQTLVDAFFNSPSLRIPATVELDGVVLDSVGTRYKGNSTFCLPNETGNVKVPYNLDFNHWISGQSIMGYKKLKLANAWIDPTYCKEYLASRIYRKYLPTPEINLMELNTQGQYTGLYVNTESINKQFCQKHFGEDDGALFKCDGASVFCDENGEATDGGIPDLQFLGPDIESYQDSYTLKSDEGWEALVDLIETLNLNPENLGDKLNIDRVLWAFAANAVVSNLDTYNGYYVHNYYMYQDEQGRFQMIPWDLDNAFVGAIMGYSYWNPNEVYHFDPFFSTFDSAWDFRPLADFVFNHPQYRKQYLAHIRTILSESMDMLALEQEVGDMQALIESAASQDANSLFGMSQFSNNVQNAFWADWGFGGILSTVEARVDFLSSHAEVDVLDPTIAAVQVANGVIEVGVASATTVELLWTNNMNGAEFEPIEMVDSGVQGDIQAGDGMYTATIPVGANPEFLFYIRASNEEAMSLKPARAEYEYYIYDAAATSDVTTMNANSGGQWTIAPNPARESFGLVNCPLNSRILIRDMQGRLVKEDMWNGGAIDIGGWARGLYMVSSEDGRTARLVVR
tara:strand:- start:3750 stop:5627 length:1878 start_codon:yes stop_codon:yes gene_type:complete